MDERLSEQSQEGWLLNVAFGGKRGPCYDGLPDPDNGEAKAEK